MQAFPYVEINGFRTFSDDYIMALYDQMEKEGTAKRVFYIGSVTNRIDFLKWMKSPNISVLIIVEDMIDKVPLALSWITEAKDGRGWFNFNIFKKAWGPQSLEVMALTKKTWFSFMRPDGKEPIFRVLMGITPANNKLAIRLMQKMGVTFLGLIPDFVTNHWTGTRCGAYLSYITR